MYTQEELENLSYREILNISKSMGVKGRTRKKSLLIEKILNGQEHSSQPIEFDFSQPDDEHEDVDQDVLVLHQPITDTDTDIDIHSDTETEAYEQIESFSEQQSEEEEESEQQREEGQPSKIEVQQLLLDEMIDSIEYSEKKKKEQEHDFLQALSTKDSLQYTDFFGRQTNLFYRRYSNEIELYYN